MINCYLNVYYVKSSFVVKYQFYFFNKDDDFLHQELNCLCDKVDVSVLKGTGEDQNQEILMLQYIQVHQCLK
jgi:hypothetical protein